jgi:hypothetical protein
MDGARECAIDQLTTLLPTNMSSQPTKLAPTNLPVEELVMDDRGVKDPRYYCLPPFRGDPSHPSPRRKGGFPFHLVAQGRRVGIFDNW